MRKSASSKKMVKILPLRKFGVVQTSQVAPRFANIFSLSDTLDPEITIVNYFESSESESSGVSMVKSLLKNLKSFLMKKRNLLQ